MSNSARIIPTYRRNEWVNGHWVSVVYHAESVIPRKTLNLSGMQFFTRSVWSSGQLVAASLPLPLGLSWDFSWSKGGTGNVQLNMFLREDGERQGACAVHCGWPEAYDDLFFSRLGQGDREWRFAIKKASAYVAELAQLPLL